MAHQCGNPRVCDMGDEMTDSFAAEFGISRELGPVTVWWLINWLNGLTQGPFTTLVTAELAFAKLQEPLEWSIVKGKQ